MEKVIICDLDGTLCDVEHRRVHIVNKDWKSFYEGIPLDKPRSFVVEILDALEREYPIYFVSGRPEEYREMTELWLKNHGLNYTALYMRPTKDNRADTLIKEEILKVHFAGKKVVLALDDRPSVIRMWRDKGIDVLDVGDGIDF